MTMVAIFLISILVVGVPSANAVQHVVGDSGGWTTSGDYSTWASSNTFNVGDSLLFNYGGSHGVNVLSKSDYDNCATSNAIKSYSDGATVINLTQPGPMYFACPSFGHCSLGMKLAINVVSSSTNSPTTPSSGNNSSPPSSTTPSTPSSTTPSTPSTSNPASNSANSLNMVMVWLSMILAPLFVFMC